MWSIFMLNHAFSQSRPLLLFTPPQIGERSIVVTASVCLYTRITAGTTLHVLSSSSVFSCMLPMSMARSSTSGVAIRYVLPVLSMTSCLYITVRNRRHSSNSVGIGMDLSPWRLLKLTHHGQHRTGAESDTRFSCISKCSPTSSSPRWFSGVERAPCTSSIRWTKKWDQKLMAIILS